VSTKLELPRFDSAQERTEWIRDNADYFTVTYRENYRNKVGRLPTLELARLVAQYAANIKGRPMMIYGIVLIPGSESGLDSWIETVKPDDKPTT
jgi:hypothetical protein